MNKVLRPCPSCSTQQSIMITAGEISQMKYELLKCKNCKHQWTFPMPKQNDLDRWYQQRSSLVLGNGANENYSDPNVFAQSTHWVISDLKEVIPGTLLEIGPGNGSLLRSLRKLGWNCYGVDPGRYISDKKILSSLQELPKGFCFDVVVFQDVLEHIADPFDYIEKISNLTNKKKHFLYKRSIFTES